MYKPRLMFQLASQPVYTTHQQNAYDFEMKAVKPAKKTIAKPCCICFITISSCYCKHCDCNAYFNFCKMPKVFPKFSPK